MRIEALLANLQQEARSVPRLLFDADARLGNVRVGDILQGRVIREIGQQQWLVRFDKAEVTVQSQVRLEAGEILKGRVREAGKQVVLERLPLVTQTKTDTVFWPMLVGNTGYSALVNQLRLRNERKQPIDTETRYGDKAATALLSRFGLGRAGDMEMRLSHLLSSYPQEMIFEDPELPALVLQSALNGHEQGDNALFITTLADWLQQLGTHAVLRDGKTVSTDQLLFHLLNVQTLDKWGHAFGAGHIMLNGANGTLVIGTFTGRAQAQMQTDTPFSSATLTYSHPQTGTITFSLVLTEQRLQLAIAVEDQTLADKLEQSVPALESVLATLGVVLDECVIGVDPASAGNRAIQSVADVILRSEILDRRL